MATDLDGGVVLGSSQFIKLRVPVSAAFEPKEDITAYELAQMMPIFHGQHYFDEEWEALPWKRHWRRTDKT